MTICHLYFQHQRPAKAEADKHGVLPIWAADARGQRSWVVTWDDGTGPGPGNPQDLLAYENATSHKNWRIQ